MSSRARDGTTLAASGLDGELPDRRGEMAGLAREAAMREGPDRQDEFGRRHEGIGAPVHGRRARMVGAALDDDLPCG